MNNSRGFIYPAAVFLAMICMLCAAHSTAAFMTKHAFIKQTKDFYIQQNLLQNGILHSIRHMQDEEAGEENKAYGSVMYAIASAGKETKRVRLKVKTAADSEKTADFQFHLRKKTISHWKEH
ncbi:MULTISPECIES: competence type IV pilus minor pilin ComGG [Bacillus]|nr:MULTISPECIES: competence type IV pilus minor pilin ComGG [Bacillus]KKB74534.1 chromosome partitioning protein ParA [Bacillus sp. TH008]MDU0072124.1 competence type IV pilus minor pilin ComGG [Bacillus sp. IG6]MED8019817.1 competence type IV pilus minor pilin ComGG [Bacillus glycinifermentans]WKB75734.1 competence type IV pilus minor pilin ComGG [Bacillus glycinifermentans]